MKIDRSASIAKVAADVPGAMEVFEALGLDYACAGDLSLGEAAHVVAVDPDAVVARLRRLKSVRNAVSWNDRRLADVMQHLTDEHHRLVAGEMRATAVCLADVCTAPAGAPLSVHSLRSIFGRLADILLPHIREEEENIFPLIEQLERAWESGKSHEDAHDLRERISRIVADHGQIGLMLRTMRDKREHLLTSNETPPNCQPILEGIAFLEAHLHQYMFLENAVLFPRAVALASQMGTVALQA